MEQRKAITWAFGELVEAASGKPTGQVLERLAGTSLPSVERGNPFGPPVDGRKKGPEFAKMIAKDAILLGRVIANGFADAIKEVAEEDREQDATDRAKLVDTVADLALLDDSMVPDDHSVDLRGGSEQIERIVAAWKIYLVQFGKQTLEQLADHFALVHSNAAIEEPCEEQEAGAATLADHRKRWGKLAVMAALSKAAKDEALTEERVEEVSNGAFEKHHKALGEVTKRAREANDLHEPFS